MKKLLPYTFLVLFFYNIGWTKSSLPECKGSDYEQWTNCQGTETWENGRKYIGEYKDGTRHGQGTMTHPDGAKYFGQWMDGLQIGKGIDVNTKMKCGNTWKYEIISRERVKVIQGNYEC